jgi:hypothetical protein
MHKMLELRWDHPLAGRGAQNVALYCTCAGWCKGPFTAPSKEVIHKTVLDFITHLAIVGDA